MKQRTEKKKKSKDTSWLEGYIQSVIQQSMKECLDKALKDLLKGF